MLILRRVRHEEKYTPQQKKDLLEGGLVCGIFLTLGTNLQQFGIADTTAGKAGFITALYIVLVPLAGMFLGKKANKRLFLCVLIAVVGLYFLCFTGSEGAMSFGRGDFLVFLCAFAFTGHILCVDHYVQKVDGIALSCVQFAVMMVLSTVCAFTFETVDFAALGECTFYILYIGILSSAGGYTLQILAQKDGDPTVVSLLLSLESFFAVVCGAIILHERMSGREYLGCALMLTAQFQLAICGSYIATENDQFYNRAFFLTPEGEEFYYDKRHLFRMGREAEHFSVGDKRLIIPYRGWNICLLVCYDLRFPVWSRNVNNEYDLLIYVANCWYRRYRRFLCTYCTGSCRPERHSCEVHRL